MNSEWNTTVTDLLGFLQEALVAIAPIAEKAQIKWDDNHAYDDWDDIAMTLYENFVENSIVNAHEWRSDNQLPKYDFINPEYSGPFIKVESESIPSEIIAAFVGFAGNSSGFTSVKWCEVSSAGGNPKEKIEYTLFRECQFYLVHNLAKEMEKIHALTIQL